MSRARPTRRVLFVLAGLAAFGPLSTDLYLPALPQTALSLHTSAAGVQLTLTASVIGLGAGQLLMGPLSDRYGRRTPLLSGLLVFIVFSMACAVSPNVAVLVPMRLGQALGGSAGLVIGRAVVRDTVKDRDLRRVFSLMVMASSLAPILAPLLGSQLIRFVSWRIDFVVLAGIGMVLLVTSWRWIPESLPPSRRSDRGIRPAVASYTILLRDQDFVATIAVFALAFGVLFAYIAESPFALQQLHGLAPQTFGLVFALNAMCIMLCSRVRLRTPQRNVAASLATTVVGVSLVASSALAGTIVTLLIGFALVCCGWGLLAPSATMLVMARHPDRAGAAAAVQGATQFLVAGVVGPLVGIGGEDSLWPLVTVMFVCAGLAIGAHIAARPSRERRQ